MTHLPGQKIAVSGPKILPGPGTYLQESQICAALAGKPATHDASKQVLIEHPSSNSLPVLNSIVVARVTRITSRQAHLAIQIVNGSVCSEAFSGIIRAQDIRATEKDKVKVGESFRPGDIVRAEVVSLGDQSGYYLSTARNELGVVMAWSEAGNAMTPVSWNELWDPVLSKPETRKVAKPS